MAATCRSATASSWRCRRSSPTASAPRSASRPAIRRWSRASPRGSASTSACRRADLRMLVGCGAAGAIAAAFGAPLTGAFYAFELIIGTYTAATLAPVLTASIVGVLVIAHVRRRRLFDHGRAAVGVPQLGPAERAAAGAHLRRHRHPDHARRHADRTRLPPLAHPARRPSDPRRADRRRPGAGQSACAVLRPRRAQAAARFRAAGDRAAGPAARPQGERLGGVAGLRLPRRPVLRLALHRRAGRQAVRRSDGGRPCRRSRPTRWWRPSSA